MKIYQYQQVYKILRDDDLQPIEKALWFWSILKKVSYEKAEAEVPLNKLTEFFKRKDIQPSPFFAWYRIGWRIYRVQLDAFKCTSGDINGALALGVDEESLVSNIHEIMATYTIRKDKSREYHKKLSEKIKYNVDAGKALSIAGFFLTNYEGTREKLLKILTNRMQKINQKLQAQT